MCARSPLDPRSSISASESHPGYLRQGTHWLCRRSDSQREAPRCFFLARPVSIARGYGKISQYRRRSPQVRATLSSSPLIAFSSGVSAQPISVVPSHCYLIGIEVHHRHTHSMLHFARTKIVQEWSPFFVRFEIFSDTLRKQDVPRIAAIHHSLGAIHSSASQIGTFIHVHHHADRTTVNSHPNLQLWISLE